MYKFILLCLGWLAIMYIFQCKAGGDFTGREYMPDMAHSRAYDTYYPSPGSGTEILEEMGPQTLDYLLFEDGKVARKPVLGTIARGHQPYPYPNDTTGYEASVAYQNPYTQGLVDGEIPKDVLDRGQKEYLTYCSVCHGPAGEGGGTISAMNGGPYAGIPNYFADIYMEMPEGKMFHSVHYGKADMGSYASQLSKDDRWKVISYIKSMQQTKAIDTKGMDKVAALMYVKGQTNVPKSPTGEIITSKLTSVKTLEKGKKMTLDNVFFSTGSANLREESYYELDLLKDILVNNNGAKVEISGHTDSDGSPESNLGLSESRSQAVYNYLINGGITMDQITFKGYGDTQPAAPNDTPENKQKNRRVEFEVLD